MNHHQGCDDKQLMLYYYGELVPAERQAVEMHLGECPDCRKAFAELQASLAAVPATSLQLSTAQKLRFAEEVTARTRQIAPRRLPTWGGAVVAAGILGLVLMLVGPDNHELPVRAESPARADIELVEQLEILQEIALLENLELLKEIECL